jgi:hypothetical protein
MKLRKKFTRTTRGGGGGKAGGGGAASETSVTHFAGMVQPSGDGDGVGNGCVLGRKWLVRCQLECDGVRRTALGMRGYRAKSGARCQLDRIERGGVRRKWRRVSYLPPPLQAHPTPPFLLSAPLRFESLAARRPTCPQPPMARGRRNRQPMRPQHCQTLAWWEGCHQVYLNPPLASQTGRLLQTRDPRRRHLQQAAAIG